MKNSTKKEHKEQAPSTARVSSSYDDVMKHIIDLTERINYLLEGMKTQAEMLKEHQDLLDRVRPRMGL